MWIRFRVVARRPEPPSALDPDLARLITLQAVVEHGCELQRRAESFLLACSMPDEPGPAVAREGGAIAREFHRLYAWSIDVEGHSADPDSVDQRVSALLLYHCALVHDAVCLAFPRFRTPRAEQRRRALSDLGDPARRLRAVRIELAAAVAAADRGGY